MRYHGSAESTKDSKGGFAYRGVFLGGFFGTGIAVALARLFPALDAPLWIALFGLVGATWFVKGREIIQLLRRFFRALIGGRAWVVSPDSSKAICGVSLIFGWMLMLALCAHLLHGKDSLSLFAICFEVVGFVIVGNTKARIPEKDDEDPSERWRALRVWPVSALVGVSAGGVAYLLLLLVPVVVIMAFTLALAVSLPFFLVAAVIGLAVLFLKVMFTPGKHWLVAIVSSAVAITWLGLVPTTKPLTPTFLIWDALLAGLCGGALSATTGWLVARAGKGEWCSALIEEWYDRATLCLENGLTVGATTLHTIGGKFI